MNASFSSVNIEPFITQFQARSYLYEGLVYQDFLQVAVELTQSQIGFFHLYSEETGDLHLAIWSDGVFPICTTTHSSHYSLKEAGIWAEAIRQRAPIIYNDYSRLLQASGLPEGHFPVTRVLSVPVFVENQIVAIMGVGNRLAPYPQSEAQTLMAFCTKIYPVIQAKVADIEKRRHRRAKIAETDTISLLIKMVSCLTSASALRDEYTSQHSQNVADLSVAIAREMKLGEDSILGLQLGALVHDIGKIAVPSEILTKPGRLNPAEYALIKTHVERGAEIFASIHFPWPILEMIEQHHERLDGSGYPLGLRNESIILEARIIAVADVFDSMSSSRPYRFAPGAEKAIAELKRGRAVLYDPYVVDALLRFLQKADETFWERYHRPSLPAYIAMSDLADKWEF